MEWEPMSNIDKSMNICMGIAMSFVLTLVGSLSSGHFRFQSFIMSLLLSSVISIMLGFVIPVGKINRSINEKFGTGGHGIKARIINSLIADIIYTPILTYIMVGFSLIIMTKNIDVEVEVPFFSTFWKSLKLCFLVGFVVVFLIQPVIFKWLMRKEGAGKHRDEKDNDN